MNAVIVKPLNFAGRMIDWQPVEGLDHGCGIDIGTLADLIEYATGRDGLRRLIGRHVAAGHFKPTEVKPVKLTGNSGKGRPGLVLSPRGVLRVCLYGNGPKCEALHEAVIDLLDALASGEYVLVRKDDATATRLLAAALGNMSVDHRETVTALREMGSALASAMNTLKEERKREREADLFEAKARQLGLALPDDPEAGIHDGAFLAALVKHGAQFRVRDIAKLAKLTIRQAERAAIRLRGRGVIHRVNGKIDLKRGTDEQPTQIGGAS